MILSPNPAQRARNKVISYCNRAGITSEVTKNALVAFCEGLFSKIGLDNFKAIYPLLGGTAFTNSLNLLSETDFVIKWNGANLVHDSNGVTGSTTNNGTSSGNYGNTGFNCAAHANINSIHCSVYNRTASISSNVVLFGANSTTGGISRITIGRNGNNLGLTGFNNNTGTIVTPVNAGPNFAGFMSGSRINSSTCQLYFNGSAGSGADSTAPVVADLTNMTLLARNSEGFDPDNNADANIAFASLGLGLTDAQMAAFYTLVQALQTALGRNV